MKRGIAVINILVVLVFIGIFSIPIIDGISETNERKELFETYIELVNKNIISSENTEETLNDLKSSEYVKCDEVILTENNEIVLNNCSVENSSKKYCYYKDKRYNCSSNKYKELYASIGNVQQPENPNPGDTDTPVDSFVPEYEVGTLLKIRVGSFETRNFYLLSETKETVTVIMDRNLGNNIAWLDNEFVNKKAAEENIVMYSAEYYALMDKIAQESGAVTATTQLNSLSWKNAKEVRLPNLEDILKQTKWYENLKDKTKFEDEFVKYYTKIINDTNVNNCSFNEQCREDYKKSGYEDILLPEWLDINLSGSGSTYDTVGYWLSNVAPSSISNNIAWEVTYKGNIGTSSVYTTYTGVRPVITIDKSYILEKIDKPIYISDERR